MERSRHHREHGRDEQRDAQPHLQGKDVERKERRPDEVLALPVASGDQHRVPVLAKNRGLLGFVQRTPELLFAILHPGDQVLRQFADDVVLLLPGQKELNGLQVAIEHVHGLTPTESRSTNHRCFAIRRADA